MLGLLAGCVVAPAIPGLEGPPMQGRVASSPTPLPAAMPSVLPFLPPLASPPPCDQQGAPFVVAGGPRGLVGRDWVLLARCGEPYFQRVGQAPRPLGIQDDDLAIHWLSSDGNTALATRSRLVAGQASQALVQRFADGRPDRVLLEGLISPSSVSISSDGETVALWLISTISSDEEPMNSLYLVRVSTAETRLVVSGAVASWWLKWSPDGRKVLFEGRHPQGYSRLIWTSWEAPTLHTLKAEGTHMYNSTRGQLSWAPNSRHVLIFDQNPMIESKRAELVTVDLEGNSVSSRPIVDAQGQHLTDFGPLAVRTDNPSVLGHRGILHADTAIVRPLSDEVLGWAQAPNTVLRWRMLPEGPVLDEVKLERLVQ
jgi:hypothetical protein